MNEIDPDAKRLFEFGQASELSIPQYALLTSIVEKTVQHKLQAFAEKFMFMSVNEFLKEQLDQKEEKFKKTGLWTE